MSVFRLLLLLLMCSLVSLNAQGLRSPDRRKTAFHFLKLHKYDIIFLQETHWTSELENAIIRDWTGDIYFNHGTANSCGVAILINPRFNYTHVCTSQDPSGRVIAITINIDNHHLHLVNLYAPNSDTDHRLFFSSLEPYLSPRYYNVIGGDFNSIVHPNLDKQGGSASSRQYALRVLNTLTSEYDLIDIWRQRNPNKRAFTRTGRDPRQNTAFISTRIDRFYTSQPLTPYIADTSIIAYPHSDHDLILLTIDLDRQPRGPGFWHFNNTLLDDAIFQNEIHDFWAQWRLAKTRFPSPVEWWEAAKQHFKRIAIKRSTSLRKLARASRDKLERDLQYLKQIATTGNPADVEKYLLAKQQLSDFEQRDLEAVKLRAKARFAEDGEKSSRYFYSLEKKKQADKRITTLTKDNLDTITSTRDILIETRAFYKKLYTAGVINSDVQQSFLDTSMPQLSESDQRSCEIPLSSAELEIAPKKMEDDKSPGIDGLTTNFYKYFWPTLGPDVTQVFNYCFEHGLLTRSQRRGVITLVFKKGDRTKLSNWRPITLLTTDYKILTKALAHRLTQVLPNIINSDQTACIPGRTINDNISLIRDVIDYANETNTPLALISIDQMKAFDRTSHSFLFATLERFGFGPNFIRWIKLIYNSVSSSVNVNGWLTSFINLERGLRQGCALSMPLYVLTAEILALRIRSNPRIQGITPPGSTAQVKLSQYADDTTFTLRDDSSIQETFHLLSLYESASGAKINLAKCKGLWAGSFKHRSK